MSSYVKKYIIHYDGNDGNTYHEDVYCKYENVWDGQLWRNSDGAPVDFGCVTDSFANAMSMCIAGIPTNNKFFYWEEVKDFVVPDIVYNSFDN